MANFLRMEEIAIIGAGVAGLTAAWALVRDGYRPVVFEKSRGLSGRAASRSRGDVRFDHGANFFRLEDPAIEHLVRHSLPTDDLVEIHGDVWTFDGAGQPAPGDPRQNSIPKFTYRHGISQLGKLLVESSGVEVRREVRVRRIDQIDGSWHLQDEKGEELGTFDRVILTAPSPQCLDLIRASRMHEALQQVLVAALSQSRYHRQFSFMLGYDKAPERPEPFHALVSTDPGHPVAWLSHEEDKPGHVPAGQGVLVVQMSPGWTDERVEVDREQLLGEVVEEVVKLVGKGYGSPDWWDSQRWMLAHPAQGVEREALEPANRHGLFFAGDALPGRGRIPLAMTSGLEAAAAISGAVIKG
jgi:predicted NAD/FAD-dependent oxidoreductase